MDYYVEDSSSNRSRRRAIERSSVIVNLPDGLLVEILCRLPRKSANRCKSVCKRWLSLMSTPYFESRFMLIRANPPPFALLVQYVTGKRRRRRGHLLVVSENPVFDSSGFSLSFVPSFQGAIFDPLYVVRSSQDLLLCAGRKTNRPSYYICNTITKHWIPLPRTPKARNQVRVGFLSDSEEECRMSSSSINSQHSYRVVLVPQVEGCSTKLNLEIFSSETWEWSEVVVPFPQGFDLSIKPRNVLPTTTNVVAYNGLLLWWSFDRGIVGYDPYNVDNLKRCWLIGKPFEMQFGYLSCFGTCRGRLRICQMVLGRLMVWELDDFGTCKWILEHHVRMNEMVSEESSIVATARLDIPQLTVLALHPHDKDILYLLYPPYVVSCNMRSKTLDVVSSEFRPGSTYPYYDSAEAFSLVFPFSPTPMPLPSQNFLHRLYEQFSGSHCNA